MKSLAFIDSLLFSSRIERGLGFMTSLRRMMARGLAILLIGSLSITPMAGAASARFISPDTWDPTVEGVGTNRYAYAANDPINNSDPNGHLWGSVIGGVIGVIGSLLGGWDRANAPADPAEAYSRSRTEVFVDMTTGAGAGQAARLAVGIAKDAFEKKEINKQVSETTEAPEVSKSQGEAPPYARDKYSKPSSEVRQETLSRDVDCVYCGEARSDTLDHVRSQKQDWVEGGYLDSKETRSGRVNDPSNLAGACRSCNSSKGSRRLGVDWVPPKDR
ncbi:RHS repeat-associated core domain-containing protein [Ensifer sp. SSB1]|jgi:hypothetical protein|uniref:RHS repeat-associated core domain-containing protein n=1 Tax=Ensifer sp. SSB1 TaxID=2795385 RepID=UPI001A40B409|nr:RHS repeat-associated core domain-containing protein [Ensifer sp. SSB1]MBK5571810.1 HNH endonuclease [Ensifer sp. SSB1]